MGAVFSREAEEEGLVYDRDTTRQLKTVSIVPSQVQGHHRKMLGDLYAAWISILFKLIMYPDLREYQEDGVRSGFSEIVRDGILEIEQARGGGERNDGGVKFGKVLACLFIRFREPREDAPKPPSLEQMKARVGVMEFPREITNAPVDDSRAIAQELMAVLEFVTQARPADLASVTKLSTAFLKTEFASMYSGGSCSQRNADLIIKNLSVRDELGYISSVVYETYVWYMRAVVDYVTTVFSSEDGGDPEKYRSLKYLVKKHFQYDFGYDQQTPEAEPEARGRRDGFGRDGRAGFNGDRNAPPF